MKQVLQGKLERIWRPIGRVLKVLVLIMTPLVFIMAILIGLSAIPKKISLDVPAVEFRREDRTYVEHTRIRIDGKWYRRWFSDPKFEGKFVIERYPYTQQYTLVEITFNKDIMNGYGSLVYVGFTANRQPIMESLGIIRMSNDLQQLSIEVFESHDADRKILRDLVISAPAHTREEAIRITKLVNDLYDQ